MIAADGWADDAWVCPSDHFNERPAGTLVSLLIIHNISLPPGEFGGGYVQRFFTGRLDPLAHPYFGEIAAMRVSSHFLIERDGELTQFVSCLDRAWHAGQSHFAGCENCNDFSVGVELEGTDTLAYTEAQYATLLRLTGALMTRFPGITPQRITGHEHVAPGRKTDPGPAFDWPRFRGALDPLADGRGARA
ncbi:1,6-anhydro-N-acetylmuramyl-L-alanine amidase AmpD [Pseudomonas sp.]|uniref:1,6-anhydro-N-acetylmuramyl-L-alanine amidase AmpD n=1 Tax=Pseudomonas sp. TaxID=306 RepID=UPI00272A7C89|nr:1,6-anhydro-N-acetylmuramyl-L-alanine amidase AmpD [Pseudomonas sp.]